jgi:hypothetical protein
MTSISDAPSQNLSRFDLPGFSLPLNFMPGMAKAESDGQKIVDRTWPTTEGTHPFANALYAGGKTGLASRWAETLHQSPLTISDRGGELSLPLITTRELTMLQLMNQITDKVNWHIKVRKTNASYPSKMSTTHFFSGFRRGNCFKVERRSALR